MSSRGLHRPESLVAQIAQAGQARRPIVALFSQEGCPWCEAIRREQLLPLSREQDRRGISVVEFDIGDPRPFASRPRGAAQSGPEAGAPAQGSWLAAESPEALARALNVRLVPVVAFLGPRGELAERLIGYGARDFYSAYLDDRIDTARRAISRP